MGGDNEGTKLQGEIARASAEFQANFAREALPSIREAAGLMMGELNPGGPPTGVQSAFSEARSTLKGEFEADRKRAAAAIKQEALQSGMNYSPAAVTEAITGAETNIARDQGARMRALNFEEANVGMNQTNRLIGNLLKTGSATAQGGIAFGGNALNSASILSALNQQNSQQNATYGSMIGTVAGGLLGSLAFGVGAAPGAAAGGAVGGLVGGWF